MGPATEGSKIGLWYTVCGIAISSILMIYYVIYHVFQFENSIWCSDSSMYKHTLTVTLVTPSARSTLRASSTEVPE